jgi:hypothetical protein
MLTDDEPTMTLVGETESFEGPPPSYSLARTLRVDPNDVSSTASPFLQELDPAAPLAESATAFATEYRAFWSFQDLMQVILSNLPLDQRHYFYYEALVYLREIGHCLLTGNYLAVLSLQRQFLELAVYHVYWNSREDDLALLYRWIATGVGKPPFKNALEELFRNLDTVEFVGRERSSELQDDLSATYRKACSYNDVAELHESYIVLSGSNLGPTLAAADAALAHARLCIQQVLFLYGLAQPMVFFPLPIEQKFGFGGPVGVFAPHETAALFTAAIGENNASSMRNALVNHPVVVSRLEWFNSLPDISARQMEHSWQEFLENHPVKSPPKALRARMTIARATWRSMGWVISYAKMPEMSSTP